MMVDGVVEHFGSNLFWLVTMLWDCFGVMVVLMGFCVVVFSSSL